jgi:hypothetical protein
MVGGEWKDQWVSLHANHNTNDEAIKNAEEKRIN